MGKCKRDMQIVQGRKKVAELRAQMQENTNKVKSIDIKTQALKQELRNIKKQQLNYYHALLQEGNDCRQEGLIWMIKIIWYLGANVNMNKLPRFLDAKAIEFLFRLAKMEIRSAELQKALKMMVNKRKEDRLKQLTLKKSEAWGGIAAGILRKVLGGKLLPRKNSKNVPKKFLSSGAVVRGYGDAVEVENDFATDTDREISKIEAELETLKADIKEAKRSEVYRISKEFTTQNYGQKYGVTQRKVMSALVGEEATHFDRFTLKDEGKVGSRPFANGGILF